MEEDNQLKRIVEYCGTSNWVHIARQLPHRSSKQCRERWVYHLDPEIIKTDWSKEEDAMISKLQAKYGNKWSVIAKMLLGRTDNAVKNRFNTYLKKQ